MLKNNYIYIFCFIYFFLGVMLNGKQELVIKQLNEDIKIQWCIVPDGEFDMGADKKEQMFDCEGPKHKVYLNQFYISDKEITRGQYKLFCEETQREFPRYFDKYPLNFPVTYVSWYDAIDFCKWLSKKTGEEIILPTEAQWEKACRAGTLGDTYLYNDRYVSEIDPVTLLERTAWFEINSKHKLHPVGQLESNNLGLYDMLGNVLEWCLDFFDEHYYRRSPKENPLGPKASKFKGNARVIRGGAYDSDYHRLRCAYRVGLNAEAKTEDVGFRVVKRIK